MTTIADSVKIAIVGADAGALARACGARGLEVAELTSSEVARDVDLIVISHPVKDLRSLLSPIISAVSSHAIFIVTGNSVDVATYAAIKVSGLDPERVVGVGTVPESLRFRSLIAQRCKVSA